MKRGKYPPDQPHRSVPVRKPKTEARGVIALTRDLCVVEELGEDVFPAEDLADILKAVPGSIIAVQGFGLHLQRLQRVCENDPLFNYRVTPIHRYSRPWNNGRELLKRGITDTVCNFVGWKRANGHGSNLYHYPLDPIWYLSCGIDELIPDNRHNGEVRIVKLYEWAKEVRNWCAENQLTVKASAGGIAAQLLRDSRFYPERRRKAPRGVNNVGRSRLPGNYYHLRAEVGKSYNAVHLDMENAHHVMARRLKFPDVNTLHAYGDQRWARRDDEVSEVRWATGETAKKVLQQPGLFHVRLWVPTIPREHFPPPELEMGGLKSVWLYSNEIDWVTRELGCSVDCVHGAYTSQGYDEGLNRYARFAIEQIRSNPSYRTWLKPTLHCAYGLLAARAQSFETGFYRAKGSETTAYPMGNVSIVATVHKREAEIESNIVNVIHRGMIEAEVRKEALRYARFLAEQREKVLAIYADAIFILDRAREDGAQLRFLQPPWRVKGEVAHIRWLNPTSFTSPSLTRLPGIPATAKDKFLAQRKTVAEVRKLRTSTRRVARRSVRAA